jgi:hypothetical protein
MPYQLLDHQTVVQVYGVNLTELSEFCQFQSAPSGSVLLRTVPQSSFSATKEIDLLNSLSDAVESILSEGIAIAAAGTQKIDDAGLIQDAVTFTVEYVPTYPIPGSITSELQIPVNVITIDTQFGSFLTSGTGGSAADQILAEYNRLKQIAGE